MDLRKDKNIAIMSICNSLSLIIRDNPIDVDNILYQYSDESEAKSTPLYFDSEGCSYFELNGERYMVSEFVAINRNYGLMGVY